MALPKMVERPCQRNLQLALFLIYAVVFILSAMTVSTPLMGALGLGRRVVGAFVIYSVLSWSLVSVALVSGIGQFIAYILLASKTCDAINALSGESAKKS